MWWGRFRVHHEDPEIVHFIHLNRATWLVRFICLCDKIITRDFSIWGGQHYSTCSYKLCVHIWDTWCFQWCSHGRCGRGAIKGKWKSCVTWADGSGRRHLSKQFEIHNRSAKIEEEESRSGRYEPISTDFELYNLVKTVEGAVSICRSLWAAQAIL